MAWSRAIRSLICRRRMPASRPTWARCCVATTVISAFSSDGRIAAQNLLVLGDPRHAIPDYDALILLSPRRSADTLLRQALTPLLNGITVERMREANFMVDRAEEPRSPRAAARFLAEAIGLPDP